jgi:hypothetical protein
MRGCGARPTEHPVAGGQWRTHEAEMVRIDAVATKNHRVGQPRLAPIKDCRTTRVRASPIGRVAVDDRAELKGWCGLTGAPICTHSPHLIGAMRVHILLSQITDFTNPTDRHSVP